MKTSGRWWTYLLLLFVTVILMITPLIIRYDAIEPLVFGWLPINMAWWILLTLVGWFLGMAWIEEDWKTIRKE